MIAVLNRWCRRIPLLDRWLIGEILAPLLFAVAAFTVVGLSIGVMFELVRRLVEDGLPAWIALQVMVLSLPRFLVLSALLTGMTLLFNDVIVPKANTRAEVTLQKALGRALATEKGKDIIYSRFGRVSQPGSDRSGRGLKQLFYSRRFDKGEMVDVTVLDFSRAGFRQMLVAERALWNEAEAKWEFLDGQILTLNLNGSTTRVDFDRYLYPLSSGPLKVARLPDDANNMTIAEAIKAERIEAEAGNVKAARKLQVRIQEKFTFPMACVVFGLIGSSLGSRPGSRTSRSQGFGISILLILGYYALSFSFSSLGVKGVLPALLAAWLPVLISLGAGSLLLRQASR